VVYGSYHNDTIADIQRRTMDTYVEVGWKYTKQKLSAELFDCISEEISYIDTDPSEVDASIEAVINKLKLITDRGI
tara:strand:+ start:659 stop:886 length:228 start_codon:yes stop_codon:yes gene_type:complete